jgi:hypothetical protein
MPMANVGQPVTVNMQGLDQGGVEIGPGAEVSGTITAVDPVRRLITVRLTATIGGVQVVQVSPDRITAVGP